MRWRLVWSWAGFTGEATDIAPRFAQVADIGNPRAGASEVRIRFKPRGVGSVARICNGGIPLYTGSGTLYLDDVEVLTGRWSPESEYGADDEPIEVVIAEDDEDGGLFPPLGEMPLSSDDRAQLELVGARPGYVSPRTVPVAYASGAGEGYPVVFGSPGDDIHPGSSCPVVADTNITAIAVMAHAGAAAGDIRLWGPEKNAESNSLMNVLKTLSSGTDYLGCQYVGVAWHAASVGEPDWQAHGSSYYASWDDTAEGLPGGAGQVLFAAAASSTVRFDMGSIRAAASTLDRYDLDFFLNDRVPPIDWLRNALLPILPIALVPSYAGLRAVIPPWLDQVEDTTYRLVEGPGFSRASAVTWTQASGLAAVRILYAYDPANGTYSRERTAAARDLAIGRIAATLLRGRGAVRTIETRLIWDDATAERVARDALRRSALPRRTVAYLANPNLYGAGGRFELRAGQPIELTDDGLRLSREAAVVRRIERDGDRMRVDVDLRDDHMRP